MSRTTLLHSRDGAFTLVELLVVIAILAILLSILMPVLNMTAIRARSLGCQDNFHQLHQAFYTFCLENGHLSPPRKANIGAGQNNPLWTWHDFLALHMRSTPFASAMDGATVRPLTNWTMNADNVVHLQDTHRYPSSPLKYRRGTPFVCPESVPHDYMDDDTYGYADYQVIVDGMPNWDPYNFASDMKYARYWVDATRQDLKILFCETGQPHNVNQNDGPAKAWGGPLRMAPGEAWPFGVYSSNHWNMPYGMNAANRHDGGLNLLNLDGTVRHIPNPYSRDSEEHWFGGWKNNPKGWYFHNNRDKRQ